MSPNLHSNFPFFLLLPTPPQFFRVPPPPRPPPYRLAAAVSRREPHALRLSSAPAAIAFLPSPPRPSLWLLGLEVPSAPSLDPPLPSNRNGGAVRPAPLPLLALRGNHSTLICLLIGLGLAPSLLTLFGCLVCAGGVRGGGRDRRDRPQHPHGGPQHDLRACSQPTNFTYYQ
jgi:hypothetical protein